MRRIAFIRSIEIQQTAPYLDALRDLFGREDVTAKLFYTDGSCAESDFPGEAEKLAEDASAEDVAARVLAWKAKGAVSLSIPDENSLRDAVVKERLGKFGIPMITHGVDCTRALANKWETKQLLARLGLDTPPGILIDGDLLNGRSVTVPAYHEVLRREAGRIGYPLLVKPLWGCLGNGIRFIAEPNALEAFLASPTQCMAVLEKCVIGELCSVEMIGQSGAYLLQPLIWKGQTAARPSFVFNQVRHSAHREQAENDFALVASRLQTLCSEFDICGCIEVEMIYAAGRYYVIEINPRVSGSTSLSIAASGYNTYVALAQMALGSWMADAARPRHNYGRVALQFPFRKQLSTESMSEATIVRSSAFHIDGRSYANAIATFDAESALSAIDEIIEHFEIAPEPFYDILNLRELFGARPYTMA